MATILTILAIGRTYLLYSLYVLYLLYLREGDVLEGEHGWRDLGRVWKGEAELRVVVFMVANQVASPALLDR